ncbi:hypothetical protein LT493_26890 [Streptomyces tricolor]|nr:hypothetical protein [Streptomyces tricolor]
MAAAGYRVDAVDRSHRRAHRGPAARRDGGGVPEALDIERDGLDRLPHPAYDLITVRLGWAFVRDRTRVLNRLRGAPAARRQRCV